MSCYKGGKKRDKTIQLLSNQVSYTGFPLYSWFILGPSWLPKYLGSMCQCLLPLKMLVLLTITDWTLLWWWTCVLSDAVRSLLDVITSAAEQKVKPDRSCWGVCQKVPNATHFRGITSQKVGNLTLINKRNKKELENLKFKFVTGPIFKRGLEYLEIPDLSFPWIQHVKLQSDTVLICSRAWIDNHYMTFLLVLLESNISQSRQTWISASHYTVNNLMYKKWHTCTFWCTESLDAGWSKRNWSITQCLTFETLHWINSKRSV